MLTDNTSIKKLSRKTHSIIAANTKSFNKKGSGINDQTKAIIGWSSIALGVLLILTEFVLIGTLMVTGGIVLVIMFSPKRDPAKKEKLMETDSPGGEYLEDLQEVVYLKIGGVIRGIIVEQIPNSQIKVQTTDGSVYVFMMNEIERITKEQKRK
jgi:hypothetical protein